MGIYSFPRLFLNVPSASFPMAPEATGTLLRDAGFSLSCTHYSLNHFKTTIYFCNYPRPSACSSTD